MNILEELLRRAQELDTSQFIEPGITVPQDEETVVVGEMSDAARRLFTLRKQLSNELEAIHEECKKALKGRDVHRYGLENLLAPELLMRDEAAHALLEIVDQLFWAQLKQDHAEALCGKRRIGVAEGFKVFHYVSDEAPNGPIQRMLEAHFGPGVEFEIVSSSGDLPDGLLRSLLRRIRGH